MFKQWNRVRICSFIDLWPKAVSHEVQVHSFGWKPYCMKCEYTCLAESLIAWSVNTLVWLKALLHDNKFPTRRTFVAGRRSRDSCRLLPCPDPASDRILLWWLRGLCMVPPMVTQACDGLLALVEGLSLLLQMIYSEFGDYDNYEGSADTQWF